MPKSSRPSLPALTRGLRVLRALAEARAGDLTFGNLQELLEDCPAPTLSRLLKTLQAEGYVEKTRDGRYTRGPEIDALARVLSGGCSLIEAAVLSMKQFALETAESIGFGQLFEDRVVLVEKVEVIDSAKMAQLGTVFEPSEWQGPVLVIAALLPKPRRLRLLKSKDSAITSMKTVRELMGAYRERGVHVEGLRRKIPRRGPFRACVAVLGHDGDPVGELHTVCPAERFARDRKRVIARLREAKTRLEERIAEGHRLI